MKWIKAVIEFFRYIFLFIIVSISILPFLWVLMSSFKTNFEIHESAFSLPKSFNFINYIDTFQKAHMYKFFLNSAIIAFFSVSIVLLIYGMAAYVFARYKFRGSDTIFGIMSVSLLIPTTAILLPAYFLVKSMGMYDTKIGLIFIYVALSLPLSLYILRSYFLTIPKDIESSAYIDGAGFARTYFAIILPLAKPGFGTAGVIAFLTCWNDFIYALIMTSGEQNRTVPLTIKFFQSQQFGNNMGPVFAATVLIVTPSIIVYLILQKQIEAGLTAGAVKG